MPAGPSAARAAYRVVPMTEEHGEGVLTVFRVGAALGTRASVTPGDGLDEETGPLGDARTGSTARSTPTACKPWLSSSVDPKAAAVASTHSTPPTPAAIMRFRDFL